MVKKVSGAYWTDAEIKEAIEEWKKKRPARLKTGEWRVEDVPFYEAGRLPRSDLWHRVDFLDEVELIYDKNWGASGLGKLREVALVRPSEGDLNIFEKQDSIFMNRPVQANLKEWQKEHDGFAQILRDNGVKVHLIEYPKPEIGYSIIGPYGPMRGMWAAAEICVVWGGALVSRYGCWNPLGKGRERPLTAWLANQGCPILYTIIGKGIGECGVLQPLADDAVLIPRGMAFNEEGINQLRPILERVGITTIVETHLTSWAPSVKKWEGCGAYHPDGFMNVLAPGKILVCDKFCHWDTMSWFEDNDFVLVEIASDE